VVPDRNDPADFEVVPADLLQPSAGYTLSISTVATDTHLQPLQAPVTIRFRTGQMSTGEHALVLAGTAAGAAMLLFAQPTPAASGEPIPAEIVDQMPLCADPVGCGAVATGHPTAVIDDAALAPGARWLAVVESDLTVPGSPPSLQVIDLNSDREVKDITGAQWPAWSPDGSTLAFVAADSAVQLYEPATDAVSSLPSGSLAAGRPVWTADSVTLAFLVAATATEPAHVELATPAVAALSAIPGLSGAASHPVAAPEGEQLAVETAEAGGAPITWIVNLATGQGPIRLPAGLTPVGFTDAGTLVAVDATAAPHLVSVSIDSGDITPLTESTGATELDSAVVSPSGRQIAYLAVASDGIVQAMIANADGTGALPLTAFTGDTEALSVTFGG
jgi:Tol biopolymer transport system component